jgi:hypothetical protein
VLAAREADPLARQDARAVLGEPLQRLDRGQELHDLGLGPRAALLAPTSATISPASSMTACAARAM